MDGTIEAWKKNERTNNNNNNNSLYTFHKNNIGSWFNKITSIKAEFIHIKPDFRNVLETNQEAKN